MELRQRRRGISASRRLACPVSEAALLAGRQLVEGYIDLFVDS